MLRSDLIKLSLLFQVASVLSMECSYCVSTHSWEDCVTREIKHACMNSACLTFHRKITLTNGNQVQYFVKACSPASLCTRDSCYDTEDGKVTWCEISCCNATLCNQNITLMTPRNSSLSGGSATRGKLVPANGFGGYPTRSHGDSRRNDDLLPSFVPRAVFKNNSKNTHKGNIFYVSAVMAASFGIVARQLLH